MKISVVINLKRLSRQLLGRLSLLLLPCLLTCSRLLLLSRFLSASRLLLLGFFLSGSRLLLFAFILNRHARPRLVILEACRSQPRSPGKRRHASGGTQNPKGRQKRQQPRCHFPCLHVTAPFRLFSHRGGPARRDL